MDHRDVQIDNFIMESGFDLPEAHSAARLALQEAGLARLERMRMTGEKVPRALALLRGRFAQFCEGCCMFACHPEGQPAREPVVVSSENCEVCQGSNNRRAVKQLVADLARQGLRKLVIVGGSVAVHQKLTELIRCQSAPIEVRFVNGTERSHAKAGAKHDLVWAQLVVIWATTPLPHAVSNLYTEHPLRKRVKLLTVTQRGINGLCTQVGRAIA